jgi:hypothetical protein
MFRILLPLLLTLSVFPTLASWAQPSKVPAIYEKVYVPGGFDSNDHVQIVGEGMFRNSCYRPADTEVRVDKEAGRILIGPAAYEYSGFCLQVILPFDRVIDVGILPAGNWDIIQASDNSRLAKMKVRPATTESADDYIYAPISQAFFRQKGSSAEIYLTGDFPNSCFDLSEVRITVEKDVIVVQPISTANIHGGCTNGKFSFSRVTQIDLVPPGRYLLHVRSMNAKAINTLVDMK